MQSKSEIRLIREALENLRRSVKECGETAPLTQALLEIFASDPKWGAAFEDQILSFDNSPRRDADRINSGERDDAVLDQLDWFDDAMREARRRVNRLALMAQAGVKAPPPR